MGILGTCSVEGKFTESQGTPRSPIGLTTGDLRLLYSRILREFIPFSRLPNLKPQSI